MTEKPIQLLGDLFVKVRLLMRKTDSLIAENRLLKEQIQQEREQKAAVLEALEEMTAKYKSLRTAQGVLSNDPQARNEASQRLKKLVQEIDKCICITKEQML